MADVYIPMSLWHVCRENVSDNWYQREGVIVAYQLHSLGGSLCNHFPSTHQIVRHTLSSN